ncbi:hypothetical protein ACOMHN_031018 [Nucella lapillus]
MSEGSDSSTDAVFYPPRFWGLDFHFNTFNKLYVADILAMKPYPSYPGAFAYRNHPVYKVDVMGVVVRKDDKPKLFLYSVDDGTGVINCCCWKRPLTNQDGPGQSCSSTSQLPGELQSDLATLRAERERDTPVYELGDLIHVRGKLKQFRDLMEIVAYYHARIDNPNHQVERMLELPHLYRHCYDKPFVPPYKVEKELLRVSKGKGPSTESFQSVKQQLKEKIQEVLKTLKSAEFSLSDLLQEPSIAELARQMDKGGQGRGLVVGDTLREMEMEEGTVCYRQQASLPFENLNWSSPLERLVLSILRTECSKSKYREKGCHHQQVLGELHRSIQYSSLHSSALLRVLGRLETNSDVIRITDRCYFPL